MKLATRIAVGTALIAGGTASGLGWLAWRAATEAAVPVELRRLERSARLVGSELERFVYPGLEDAFALRELPEVQSLLDPNPATSPSLRAEQVQRLAAHFHRQIQAKPHYLQVRLLEGQGGREVVRVDRSGASSATRVVPELELQQKGNRDYFAGAMSASESEGYVSRIELNQENGLIDVPHTPVIRVAANIRDEADQVLGFVMLNIDLRSALHELHRVGEAGEQLFIGSETGDYILHPDSALEHSLQLGGPHDWRRDFPASVLALPVDSSLTATYDAPDRLGLAATANRLADGPIVTVILTEPEAAIIGPATAVRKSVALGGIGFAAVAVLLGVAFSRSVSRPVLALRDSVSEFGRSGEWAGPAGTVAVDELNELTEAFSRMAREVADKAAGLEREAAERRRAEAALAEEAVRLRNLSSVVESSDDAILTKTLDGIITSWNRAAEKLYGYSAEEAVGQSVEIIVPPDKVDELHGILDRIRSGDKIQHLETVRVSRSGRVIDVSLSISPVHASSGVLVGSSVIARDITERKLAAERFRLAVEASPSGIVMTDSSGAITLVNAETERLFGYTREELLGKKVEVLMPQRFREEHPRLREDYAKDPSRRAMGHGRELFGLHREGREFPVEVGLTPLRTGTQMMTLAVIIDVTERTLAAEAIAKHAAELERSNADLATFAYVASHDLQEPLRMVSSYVDLLAQRYSGQLDAKADKYIGYAVEGTQRMQMLISDLLEYSRVGTRGKPFESTDSRAVVDQVLHELGPAIRAANAEIEIGDLPTVIADPIQLNQAFRNLIGNAIKFRSDAPPRISVTAERDHKYWKFAVSDNGIGIEPQYAERVFDMFERLHARGQFEGSGIGLAIVRKIAGRHGGSAWVESGPNQGSTFFVTIAAT